MNQRQTLEHCTDALRIRYLIGVLLPGNWVMLAFSTICLAVILLCGAVMGSGILIASGAGLILSLFGQLRVYKLRYARVLVQRAIADGRCPVCGARIAGDATSQACAVCDCDFAGLLARRSPYE